MVCSKDNLFRWVLSLTNRNDQLCFPKHLKTTKLQFNGAIETPQHKNALTRKRSKSDFWSVIPLFF